MREAPQEASHVCGEDKEQPRERTDPSYGHISPSAKQSAACFFRVGMLDDVAVEMTSVVGDHEGTRPLFQYMLVAAFPIT